ncbi:hypothetical protein F5Y10DRAFT_246752 [Nemania abortiva]|nr:hypothetical protein F5Y10DRAFT_246752 [Nemania abortiva]
MMSACPTHEAKRCPLPLGLHRESLKWKDTVHISPCSPDLHTCQSLYEPMSAPSATISHTLPLRGEVDIPRVHRPNTVTDGMGPGDCEFVQIPPSINQPCRINLAFCNPDTKNPQQWKPVDAWDGNAAFGWVAVNYTDYGLQFFVEDGTFYRELRFGGPLGIVQSPAWTPFGRPKGEPSDDKKRTQLDLVIDSLMDSRNPGYMKAFYRMITRASGEIKAVDSSYARYLNDVAGRPLALVNIGISLELEAAPLGDEGSEPGLPQRHILLDSNTPNTTSRQYSFPVQIGDKQRSYDGLLGFWKPMAAEKFPKELVSAGRTGAADDKMLIENFDYSQLYTFWPDPESCLKIHEITANTLSLKPFYVPPDESAKDSENFDPIDPEERSLRRNSHLQVISALIDPFTAVHAFSDILPTKSITLPRWITEAALSKMTAFFHLGPVLVTSDVPSTQDKFEPEFESDNGNATATRNIGLPALDTAQWNWLQPCVHDDKPDLE